MLKNIIKFQKPLGTIMTYFSFKTEKLLTNKYCMCFVLHRKIEKLKYCCYKVGYNK